MRLPWQKDGLDTKKASIKDMLSVGNRSTGSFEDSSASDKSKISKLRKEMKKSEDVSSSEADGKSPSPRKKTPSSDVDGKSPLIRKKGSLSIDRGTIDKSSTDEFKGDKTVSLDVPKITKHRRKSVDLASLSDASAQEFQKRFSTPSADVLPVPVPITNLQPASASSNISTPEEKKEKKKKKPKGLGPKPPKIGKDGVIRRVVSFSEHVERLMPNGKIESAPVNVHENVKGEIPYHKRGKEEYRMKRALLKAAAIAAGEKLSDDEEERCENDKELLPSFNLLISADEGPQLKSHSNDIDLNSHAIHILGSLPQSHVVNNNGLNISIQSCSISRYSPDIKGVLVIGNSQNILPASDESHYLKTNIQLAFDDWDTKKTISADMMDPGLLNMMLKSNPSDQLKDNYTAPFFTGPNEISEKVGLLFTIPIEELFLPSLYEMLTEMGMEPHQPKFEVEGVIILTVTVYKSRVLFRQISLEDVETEKLMDSTFDKLQILTIQNSLSNENDATIEHDPLNDSFSPEIQITRSSVTEDPKKMSNPELPKIQGPSSDDSSNSSQELSASFNDLPIWNHKNRTLNSLEDSINSKSPPNSRILKADKHVRQGSTSALDLNDQLVLSVKFEIGFKVEKSQDGGAIKSFDMLHVGYQKATNK